MEQTWALNEIVSAIAANIVSDDATASAVSLARCSKSLEEPVLREVWRRLDSLEPLVKCFPAEVWELEDGQLIFRRAPFRAEWTRFQQKYAPKVRNLAVVSSLGAAIPSATLQLLQLYSNCSPLLPNLVSLNWGSDDDACFPFLSSLISHSLTSIIIEVPKGASRMVPPILTRLSTMSSDIGEISVEYLEHEPSMEEASSQFLMQCNPHRLRKYNILVPLSTSAISHIIQLSSLKDFWLVHPFQFPDPLPAVVFPSLQILDVSFDGNPTWLKLLPAIQSRELSGISVECPEPDVARFMEAFQLTTVACGMHERLEEFGIRSLETFEITPQIIAYTFSFKNLTSLKFDAKCFTSCQTLDLTDGDIELLTTVMPGLKSLAIGEEPCMVPSKITFKSLYTLSSRCTRLEELQIHFNPDSFIAKFKEDFASVEAVSSDLKTPSRRLTHIDVGYIALPRHPLVSTIMALGLLGVFPGLEKIKFRDAAWKEIDNLIRAHRHMYAALVNE